MTSKSQHNEDETQQAPQNATVRFTGDFDEILEMAGGFGRFQWKLYAYMQLPFVFLGFVYLSQIWLVLEPDHWCYIPQLETAGWSVEQIRDLAVPVDNTGAHSKCLMYDVNYTSFLLNDSRRITGNTTTVPCRHGWSYDFSTIYPTIVSDLDWVCDDAWKATFTSCMFFLGAAVGTALFSHLSDKYGRLPILVATNLVACVSGFVSAFSHSLALFTITRFAYGLSFNTQCTQAIVLLSEFVSPRYRSMILNLPLATTLCLTMALMPWLAKALYHWKYMAIATSLPMCLVVLYYCLDVPESCRWQQQKGRLNLALKRMKHVAKVNGREIPEHHWHAFEAAAELRYKEQLQHPKPTIKELLQHPRQKRRTYLLVFSSMAVLLCFDLIVRNTQFDVDLYIGQSLLALSEAPADLLTWFLLETVGRRWTSVTAMTGCCMLAAVLSLLLTNTLFPVTSTAVAFACRFFATIGVNSVLEQCIELFSTDVRSRGFGLTQVAGELATAASPLILYLERLGRGVPMALLSVVALSAALVLTLLPETKGFNLPDTLREGEEFGKDQTFWQWYWHKPKKRKLKSRSHCDKGVVNAALETDDIDQTKL